MIGLSGGFSRDIKLDHVVDATRADTESPRLLVFEMRFVAHFILMY